MNKNKKLTKLRATQTLLQKAHDYIELNGFAINEYIEDPDNPKARCCYIGTVRKVAGLDPQPPPDPCGSWPWTATNTAYIGDGPELVFAFRVLDRLAKKRLDADRKDEIKQSWHGKFYGRFVEALGFQLQSDDLPEEAQTEEALRIFRAALTEIYNEIEKTEAQL